jgi:DnaJ-class molecular chaperone
MTAMKNLKSKGAPAEVKCSDCDGTGFPAVAQPVHPVRKIYPPPCKRCLGKGRIRSA